MKNRKKKSRAYHGITLTLLNNFLTVPQKAIFHMTENEKENNKMACVY